MGCVRFHKFDSGTGKGCWRHETNWCDFDSAWDDDFEPGIHCEAALLTDRPAADSAESIGHGLTPEPKYPRRAGPTTNFSPAEYCLPRQSHSPVVEGVAGVRRG